MKWYKISALIYREMRIFRNMRYKPIEFFYFPIVTVMIWGMFSVFVRDQAAEAGLIVLIVNVFWSFAHTAQNSINVAMLDDVWSGSLKNILVSGISSMEYLIARMITSLMISMAMVFILLGFSLYLFNAYIIATHFSTIILFIALTIISSLALAAFVAGMILILGKEYGFLSWTAMEVFVLLSAPFFPVSLFPEILQPISWAMPFTNIFEGLRYLITTGSVEITYIVNGAIVSFIYLFLSFPFYKLVFEQAKKRGNLVRLGN